MSKMVTFFVSVNIVIFFNFQGKKIKNRKKATVKQLATKTNVK